MHLYELDFLLSLELSPSGCHHIYECIQLTTVVHVSKHLVELKTGKKDVVLDTNYTQLQTDWLTLEYLIFARCNRSMIVLEP